MKVKTAVQMLTPGQFRQVFGRLSETDSAEDDRMLEWYRGGGWRKLSEFEFEKSYAERVGAKEPQRPDYDEEWKYRDAYEKYKNDTFGRRDTKRFGANAAAALKKAIGVGGFKFAGMGAYKAVFVDSAGHALKVARRRNQSISNEIRTSLRHEGLECFPKLLAYAPDFTSYICECAMRPKEEDFERLLGFDLVWTVIACSNPERGRFREQILPKAGQPRYKALVDLSKFLQEKDLGDIYVERNWGITVRGGEEVLVVTDYDI